MANIPIVLLIVTLGVCDALWPNDGLHYCDEIVHSDTADACTECFNAAIEDSSDKTLTKDCMTQYMPPALARCAKNLGSGNNKFNKCVQNAARAQSDLDQRTRHLYKKAGAMLDIVLNADHIPRGPEALLSCMAQDILFYEPELESTLRDVAPDCWDRFQLDDKNAEWHLNSGKPWRSPTKRNSMLSARNIQFEYGVMGHDMPFHGVGPLAVDYLKGECVIKDMVKNDREGSGTSLQSLVDTILKYDAPVPAWLFREMMNNIDLISLA